MINLFLLSHIQEMNTKTYTRIIFMSMIKRGCKLELLASLLYLCNADIIEINLNVVRARARAPITLRKMFRAKVNIL